MARLAYALGIWGLGFETLMLHAHRNIKSEQHERNRQRSHGAAATLLQVSLPRRIAYLGSALRTRASAANRVCPSIAAV